MKKKSRWTMFARARKPKPRGVMNGTEKKFYESHLVPLLQSQSACAVWYEQWSWTLTTKTPGGLPGTRYMPDFVVLRADGELDVYEVKGSGNARRQDLNRVKQFADLFPLRVYVATLQTKRQGGGFKIEEY